MKAEKTCPKSGRRLFISAGCCLVIAGFFAFALAGYRFIALFFVLLAAALALYGWFAVLSRKDPKTAKRFRLVLTILICICAAALIAIEIPIVSAAAGDPDPEADYLLVLGAGVNGSMPSLSLRDRLVAAKAYLERYPNAKCILSGGMGPGEDITEASCMYTWLTGAGIDPQRLILEDQAVNTEENLAFSRELMPDNTSMAIVSSEYHLYRAKQLAARQGMDVFGVPARTSLPVLMLNGFFREAFAVVKLWGLP